MDYKVDDDLQERMSRHSADNLDDEIRLAKSLLELRLSLCRTDAEKAQLFATAVQAISNIEKMVHDRHKFQERASQMLSRSTVENLGIRLVEILTKYLKPLPNSDDIIAAAAADIVKTISDAKNQPETE